MSLTKAIGFVTGGSGGLGRSICRALAAAGADIAVGYWSGRDRAVAVCDEIAGLGRRAMPVHIDLGKPDSVDEAVKQAEAEFGGLDLLVNNAAVAMAGHDVAPGDLAALTPEIWDQLMALNVRGPFLVTRAAAPALRASPWGRVVNIGSTLAHGAWYNDRAFAPSKGAVVPLTRFLAASLAPDVTVNCVSPGLMLGTALGGTGGDYSEAWRARSALGTTTALDDVARHVVALLASATITGQAVVVDAGINFH